LKKLSKLQEVIKYKNNFASFQFADFIYIANVLEGPYPDYERVIPSNFEKETSLTKGETEQFINALKKIAPIADQKTSRNGGTNCQIAIVKGWAIHKSKDAGVKVKVKLPGDYWPRPMGFNAKLLLRCLEDQHGACIIKGGSCLGATMIVSGNRRTIIMPLRLLDEECDLMTPLFNIEEYISL
jgi:DNA polymerase III sliding clamp (beta) subunit (PCNA family)